ncbi:DUF1956 domain-containing protein [Exilibacterium tricleocarpae]|uniref:DUF1956 domain-containing protein n=1 Tax=Exilibacterium tricleocarpae TaxID=2591008 RepID=A0A545TAD0_9GAMM|nr:CerR family C-terminal domain-containing protein [Exilibacterium tricleocarpae]TQV74171.1 DUF1956 domain-containing protein [Exilibacterium tricleocarpae]
MPLEPIDKPDTDRMSRRGEKRYALIMAGLKLFGRNGLDATTTRMLSEESGANIAAIPYYFGSKEGLYRAVVEYITDRIEDSIGNSLKELEQSLKTATPAPAQALVIYKSLMANLATLLVESDEPKAWAQIIMREQANPTEAYDIFHDRHMKRILHVSHRLISIITGIDAKSSEVKIRAHALFGQILGFLVSRETLLRSLKAKKLTKAHLQEVHRVLALHIDACLG